MARLIDGEHSLASSISLLSGVIGMLMLLATALLMSSTCVGAPAIQTEIEEALTCQCGCGLTVHRCNHVSCPSAIPLRKEIASLIAEGLSQEEILEHFRKKYGEKILSSPTATGFNITAWLAPFLALLLAAGAIIKVTRKWRQNEQKMKPALAGEDAHSERLREKLAQELEKFES